MSGISSSKQEQIVTEPITPEASPERKKPSWLPKMLLAILVILGGLAGVVALQPEDFRVVRSATIAAPPEKAFAQVNDFHHWEAWSPWAKLDPDANNTFEGPEAGNGAIFKWSGNDKVGEGQMTLLESRPNELIRIKLGFVRPFEDTSDVEFTFAPKADQTLVTWTMSGKHTSFLSKAICLVMNMDKMVGSDFEKGLASMKQVVESERSPPASDPEPAP
jgi:uncharacterized protein YndB with AHSA1/START domain